MIVQMTMTRNESFLLKELLPIWSKYADGFVFLDDSSTDDTVSFLHSVKNKYNILDILESKNISSQAKNYETSRRQTLFNTAVKYTNNIICLDSDEYLDGTATKSQLENLLNKNLNTTLMLKWIQYTSKHQRRIDSFWKEVFHDRAGNFLTNASFGEAYSHSGHVPSSSKVLRIDPSQLFVAHLQWLDKRWVGIKQYYWKTWDHVFHEIENGVRVLNRGDYDASVNNFAWEYEEFSFPLQIREDIYSTQSVKDNYKLKYIVEQTKKYNLPNLGDWGMGIYEFALKS